MSEKCEYTLAQVAICTKAKEKYGSNLKFYCVSDYITQTIKDGGESMKCPKCEEKTKVTDSRLSLSGKEVLRVRTCPSCFYTFKTMEWEDDSEDMAEEWRTIQRMSRQRYT